MSGEGSSTKGWYCRDCGTRYNDRAVPCEQCGGYSIEPIGGRSEPGTESQTHTPPPDDNREYAATGAEQSRRRWLKRVGVGAGALALGTAGLFALGVGQSTHRPASDAWAAVDEERDRYRQQMAAEVILPPGTYTTYTVTPSRKGTALEIHTGVSQGVLDIWTIAAAEFDAYENQERSRSRNELSQAGVAGPTSLVSQIPQREYYIVFDNTSVFGSEPDGEAVADVELVIRLLSQGWFDFQADLDGAGIEYEQLYPTENRAQWVLMYEHESENYEPVREILRLYAEHVPGDEYPHRQLVLRLSSSGELPATLTVPARLARRYKRGEITERQYFEEIVN